MNPGHQFTAGGLVPAPAEGQALWLPVTVTVTGVDRGLQAMPSATSRDYCGEQAHAMRGRACPPMSQPRRAAVPARRWP